jgi:hypothetical protein
VFLGPTIPVDEARAICVATYLPPVTMGDIYALQDKRPSTIAIIDGTFQDAPAVWHKEILYALDLGTRVIGASSMGALRAAELHPFGMEGVGAIYEAFRDGIYNDDDEVAVVHAAREHNYRPLSEAMVNIRSALAEAFARKLIGSETRDELVRQTKRLFYPDRSWPAVFEIARRMDLPASEIEGLELYVRSEKPSAKRADAVLLLRALAAEPATGRPANTPKAPSFEATWFWNRMVESERQRRAAGAPWDGLDSAVNQAAVARHVRLFEKDRSDLLRSALLMYFLEREAERLEGSADRLQPVDRVDRLENVFKRLMSTLRAEIDRYLPLELRRRGELQRVCRRVEQKWGALAVRGISEPTIKAAGISEEALMSWTVERLGLAPVGNEGIDALVDHLGFSSLEELLREAVAEYLSKDGSPASE